MGLAPVLETAGTDRRLECEDSDGLIDPAGFACRASDLQPSRIEIAAADLSKLGQAVRWQVTGIAADWHSMRPWYVAPEQEALLGLMDAPATDAREMEESLGSARRILEAYASELQDIRHTLAELEWRAEVFRARVRNGVMVPASEARRPTVLQSAVGLLQGYEPEVLVPWFQDTKTCAENAALLAEYWQVIERLSTAADDVENGMRGLLTETALVEDTTPIPAAVFDASYIEMPWGWPVEEDRNVLESLADGGGRIGQTVLDLLPLLSADPKTASQAWGAMADLAMSVVVAAAYPESRWARYGLDRVPWMHDRYRTAETLGLAVGYDASAAGHGASPWHAWDDDAIATGIEAGFNVASISVPSAGISRFAALSARSARATRWTALAADVAVPGGSFLVAGSSRFAGSLGDAVGMTNHLRVGVTPVNLSALIDGAADTIRHPPALDRLVATRGVRPELLSPWHPGLVSTFEPLQPHLARAQTYASGDVRLPGWETPWSPENTFTPGSGGEGWYAEARQVEKPAFQYQIQVSGILPDANGMLPEYYRTTPDGREISYDGMVMRDDIPVHQEMKNGWDDLAFRPDSPEVARTLSAWTRQAARQVAALPPGGVLEWHLSNPHAAAALRDAFSQPHLCLEDVVVLYTPRL